MNRRKMWKAVVLGVITVLGLVFGTVQAADVRGLLPNKKDRAFSKAASIQATSAAEIMAQLLQTDVATMGTPTQYEAIASSLPTPIDGHGESALSPDGISADAIHITTDKAAYSAGDTVRVGLDVCTKARTTSQGAEQLYSLLILLCSPDKLEVVVRYDSVWLPAGWMYSNPELLVWSLPAIEQGTYVYYAMLVPQDGSPSLDSAAWHLTSQDGATPTGAPMEQ